MDNRGAAILAALIRGCPYLSYDEPQHIDNPLVFYSCDVASQDDRQIGEDVCGVGGMAGSFADWCEVVGPHIEATIGTGPAEAVWLTEMSEGSLDSLGDFGYFEATDGSRHFGLQGNLMHGAAQATGPGWTDGTYEMFSIWSWILGP